MTKKEKKEKVVEEPVAVVEPKKETPKVVKPEWEVKKKSKPKKKKKKAKKRKKDPYNEPWNGIV